MDLGIVNASTLVKDEEARAIADALDLQLHEDVLPAWDRLGCRCLWLPGGTSRMIPAGVLPLYLFDSPDSPEALGYHDEGPDGFISGKVFVRPILDAGGGVLDGKKLGDSVSAVASHEAIEAKFDPNINLWADGPVLVGGKWWSSVSYEMCDPVQAGSYVKGGVLVSDFVLRAWFDPKNAKGPFNHLRTLKAPLTVDRGGYLIVRNAPGTESSIFGETENARPWRTGNRRAVRLAGATSPR